MIYFDAPSAGIAVRLAELDGLRETLGQRVGTPSPWVRALRRLVGASSVASSIEIEGYVEGGDESQLAFEAYARAMDHVGVMADDPCSSGATG